MDQGNLYDCLSGKATAAGLRRDDSLDGWFASKAGVASRDVTCPDMTAKTAFPRVFSPLAMSRCCHRPRCTGNSGIWDGLLVLTVVWDIYRRHILQFPRKSCLVALDALGSASGSIPWNSSLWDAASFEGDYATHIKIDKRKLQQPVYYMNEEDVIMAGNTIAWSFPTQGWSNHCPNTVIKRKV